MSKVFKSTLTLSDSGFLFDHSTGLTYTLNETGSFIFKKLEEGTSLINLLELLTEEFEITEETARKDLDDFVRELKKAELIN